MRKPRSERMSWILRALIKSGGYTDYDLQRPIVEIVNTWSEWNPGHNHLRMMADAVKRGVWAAGGFPIECNTVSLCPGQSLPNRNLLALQVESMISGVGGERDPAPYAEPADAVVFICSCDKDVPALLMAAARINIPAIFVLGGSMFPGKWKGEDVVCCTDAQRLERDLRAGKITEEEWREFQNCVMPCSGACGPMGTANTMQSMAEALGMSLPGSASIPAVLAEAYRKAEESGRKIIELLKEDIKPRDIMTEEALENAIKVLMGLGGSTNAVIHLIAIARQLDIDLPIERFDEISRETPFIVDVKPSGRYSATDVNLAGGIPAVMKQMESLLNLDVLTVTGKTLGENLSRVEVKDPEIIRPIDNPILPEGGLAILKGNLAPNGAVLKHSASINRNLLQHEGPAMVFNSPAEAYRKLLNEDLEITEDHVLVLRYQGPKGACMPETGPLPIPTVLAKKGVEDMLRITDARMSGTNFGTIVLHVSPEAYVGGTLAVVEDGDIISLDFKNRRLEVKLTNKEIKERLERWKPPEPSYNYKRGPHALWYRFCTQAHEGCVYPFM
ncbi:dihydroxy-acid dehydratase [Candidatus Bathyarchaeota archaeon]|nr:MAG: dihydroxy-acid dehydratase [Candidatus Bathyarchaeota archaeon]